MSPEQIAAEVLGVPVGTLTAERIKGGLTNESWSVRGEQDAVVVRISTADERALQLNRPSEAIVLQRVQQADIGAEVLLWAPERRVMVTRQLRAETLTANALRDAAIIAPLTTLLQRLHSLPVPPGVQATDLLGSLQGYWHSLDQQETGLADFDNPQARIKATEIALASAQTGTRCLCHNDVHHLNLLGSPRRLWLLDWEYAGVGDPLFDLAAVCCYHDYDATLRAQLLQAYCGESWSSSSNRLQQMCWLFDYIRRLWLAVRGSQL